MTTGEPGGAVQRLERARSGPRWSRPVVVVTAVALVLAALLVWRWNSSDPADAAESSAMAVARQRAVQITTYTPATYSRDIGWARTGATRTFAAEYARANAPLRKVITKVQASAKGHVVAAAATARDADHVTVLLFVDQVVTQGATGQQKTEDSRVEMVMVRRDGRWLVDDVSLR